jgi:hypothetical protein
LREAEAERVSLGQAPDCKSFCDGTFGFSRPTAPFTAGASLWG